MKTSQELDMGSETKALKQARTKPAKRHTHQILLSLPTHQLFLTAPHVRQLASHALTCRAKLVLLDPPETANKAGD